MPDPTMSQIEGPFGSSKLIETVPVSWVAAQYQAKCGYDVLPHLKDTESLQVYECSQTGYRFWRPTSAAGDESFYRGLSAVWPEYYRDWRWEYGPVLSLLKPSDRLLEVGSGRGFFLKLTEGKVQSAMGLELNQEAIRNKVTSHDIHAEMVEECARQRPSSFDIVCSFQVLEHVTDPASFIQSCAKCAKPNGLIAFSTPNIRNRTFARREDAFDMPPHHVGHFSPKVYRRIAGQFGLTVESIEEQGRFVPREDGLKSAVKRVLNVVHRSVYGPGPNVLAVLRKH